MPPLALPRRAFRPILYADAVGREETCCDEEKGL